MKSRPALTREQAEALAIQALTFISADEERLDRFLAVTGIGQAEIRAAARQPGFLSGVLEYMASDDRLMAAFAGENNLDPADVDRGRVALAGVWERDVP